MTNSIEGFTTSAGSAAWKPEDLLNTVKEMRRPVLSLYLPTAPQAHDNNPHATIVRASNALREIGAPEDVSAAILKHLQEAPQRRATAIFADGSIVHAAQFDADLPLLRGTGQVPAGWGEPVVSPLLLLASQLRAAIFIVDHERVTHLQLSSGTVQQQGAWTREELWVKIGGEPVARGSKQVRPSYTPSRGGAVRDLEDAHDDAVTQRFFREVATNFKDSLSQEIESVLVLGAAAQRHSFIESLPTSLQAMVDKTASSAPSGTVSPDAVRKHCQEHLDRIFHAKNEEYLAQILESVTHLKGDVAESYLDEGRIHKAAIAWELPEAHRETLARAAIEHGTLLRFIEGELGSKLCDEHEGILAIPRW